MRRADNNNSLALMIEEVFRMTSPHVTIVGLEYEYRHLATMEIKCISQVFSFERKKFYIINLLPLLIFLLLLFIYLFIFAWFCLCYFSIYYYYCCSANTNTTFYLSTLLPIVVLLMLILLVICLPLLLLLFC